MGSNHNKPGTPHRKSSSKNELKEIQMLCEQLQSVEYRSKDWIETLTEIMPIPVMVTKLLDSLILYANANVGSHLGLPAEALTGMRARVFYYNPIDHQEVHRTLRRQGYISNIAIRSKKWDGTPFWNIASALPVKLDGENALIVAMHKMPECEQAATESPITSNEPHITPVFKYGDLVVDFSLNRVFLGCREVSLTKTEYLLMACLARNPGKVMAQDTILRNVWGSNYVGEHHVLEVNMARIRLKLGDDAKSPRYIVTEHGRGYMLVNRSKEPLLESTSDNRLRPLLPVLLS